MIERACQVWDFSLAQNKFETVIGFVRVPGFRIYVESLMYFRYHDMGNLWAVLLGLTGAAQRWLYFVHFCHDVNHDRFRVVSSGLSVIKVI